MRSSDPSYLVYILRAAAHDSNYPWLLGKFIFYEEVDRVRCHYTNGLDFTLVKPPEKVEEEIPIDEGKATLIYIANLLVKNRPASIKFTSPHLSEEDLKNLQTLTLRLSYTLEDNKDSLIIRKNADTEGEGKEDNRTMGG